MCPKPVSLPVEEEKQARYLLRVEYLGQGYREDAVPLYGWFREIGVKGDLNLDGLNDFIQQILGWDNTHLYYFEVHNRRYAYLGQDEDFVVEDTFENHFSTKIPLYLLAMSENEHFIYYSDFGDEQVFLLTVCRIEKAREGSPLPIVIQAEGNDLIQYERPDDEGESFGEFEKTKSTPSKVSPNLGIPKKSRNRDNFVIDFIVSHDKDIFDQWRKSKDKRKWEVAVSILENRSMSLEAISEKIEKPLKKVKEWVLAFNYYGMEGLQQTFARKKRTETKKLEKMEVRKKRLIEIIHHKPTYYKINRSGWNLDSLAKVYQTQFGERIAPTTIARYLKSVKYTIKKARKVLTSPDPDYREKVETLLTVLNSLGSDDLLFL